MPWLRLLARADVRLLGSLQVRHDQVKGQEPQA